MRHIWLIDIVLIYHLVYNPRRHLMVSTQLDLHVSTGSSSETLHSCFCSSSICAWHRLSYCQFFYRTRYTNARSCSFYRLTLALAFAFLLAFRLILLEWKLPRSLLSLVGSWGTLQFGSEWDPHLKCIHSLHFPSDREDWCVQFYLIGFGIWIGIFGSM